MLKNFMTPQDDSSIKKAVAARDAAAISRLLDRGLDAGWKDEQGNTLLHVAARAGDTKLIDKLQEKGATAFVFNTDGESPFDIAAMWGNDAAAKRLSEMLTEEITNAPKPAIPYKSMQEIRDANAFFTLAQNGQFAQVVALAEKEGGFLLSDFQGKGPSGDTVALKLAQNGQLEMLLKPALWLAKPTDFEALWESIPANYRSKVDHTAFAADLRQAKLQSYAKPKLPGFKQPPKLTP